MLKYKKSQEPSILDFYKKSQTSIKKYFIKINVKIWKKLRSYFFLKITDLPSFLQKIFPCFLENIP